MQTKIDTAKELLKTAYSILDSIEGSPDRMINLIEEAGQEIEKWEDRIKSDSCFMWLEESRKFYRTFGHIKEGDIVKVETPPIFKHGTLHKAGLVRKVRK